jgi:hypothetical protein
MWGGWVRRPNRFCDLFSTTSETRAAGATDAEWLGLDTPPAGRVRERDIVAGGAVPS